MSFADLPEWARYLIQGIAICAQMVFCAIIVTRAGRSPYWALLSVVPLFYVFLIAVWAFAFCHWPKVRKQSS
jgi:hypothetical protein